MRLLASLALMTVALLAAPADLLAQRLQDPSPRLIAQGQAGLPPGDDQAGLRTQTADQTRNRLQSLLFRMPPNVRAVLQADPSLIERADYLAPYPELRAFLEQHPEVARNPGYFFGSSNFGRATDPLDFFAAVLAGTALFVGFITVMVILGSMVRQVVDYRRWVRQSKMQTEVHTKILDRLQSNDDLLAYVQTPAGRHFLEFTPLQTQAEPRATSAPLSRILWSVQAGVVLAALGLGLWQAQGSVPDEAMPAFNVLGTIVLALGAGAVMSAVVAYILSARFGILPARRQES